MLYIGEKVTICDKVFRESNKAFSVGLYLGDDSPGAYVVVSIRFKSQFRHAVGADYFHFEGKKICVTGIVRKGVLIKVNDPAQIKIDTSGRAEKTERLGFIEINQLPNPFARITLLPLVGQAVVDLPANNFECPHPIRKASKINLTASIETC